MGPEAFVLTVFAGEGRRGNATGLAIGKQPWSAAECRRLAAALAFPDSGFLFRDEEDNQWRLMSYSPFEPLAVCFQTLLASGFVLRNENRENLPALLQTTPEARHFQVSDQPNDPSLMWVCLPRNSGTAKPAPAVALQPLGHNDGDAPAVVVDLGRSRVLCEVPSARLAEFNPSPEAVMSFCRDTRVNGICLFARGDDGELDARVFTTSLLGHEDCGTGGAIASIAVYLGFKGRADAAFPTLKVRQGHGREGFGGLMMLRADHHHIWLGGHVQLVLRGHLATLS